MNKSIIIVDDELNILNSLKRQLKGKYELFTAESANEAIKIIEKKEFAVVVSDYKMPEINGADFLNMVKKLAPDTVRIMLTGQADIEAVIKVINEGDIFRFLTKPCPPELFIKNLDDGIRQFNLVKTEKYLLTKTLGGSLQVMSDLLVLAKPIAFNRTMRIKDLVKKILSQMKPENAWQIEIAATLSQIGCITIPDLVLEHIYQNIQVSPEDKILYNLQTKTASEIIAKIPRLEPVAEIIGYQEKYYNGAGFPGDELKGDDIPLGSRILRVVIDFDILNQHEQSFEKIISVLKSRIGFYDEKIISVLYTVLSEQDKKKKYIIKKININELNDKMLIAETVNSSNGETLCITRQRVTDTLIIKLKNYSRNKEIGNTIKVIIPEE